MSRNIGFLAPCTATADGDAQTGPNTLFATQGVYVA
jgi:hypothetical protein